MLRRTIVWFFGAGLMAGAVFAGKETRIRETLCCAWRLTRRATGASLK
jgi:hypothetical protein